MAEGRADVALGLEAAALRWGLGFVPLFEERFDLIFPVEETEELTPLLDTLQTAAFRRLMRTLHGYNPAHAGEEIEITPP